MSVEHDVPNLEARLITLEVNQEQFKKNDEEIKLVINQMAADVQEIKTQLARWGGIVAAVAAVATTFGIVIANVKAWLGIVPSH